MKKILALLVSFMLMLSLVSCSIFMMEKDSREDGASQPEINKEDIEDKEENEKDEEAEEEEEGAEAPSVDSVEAKIQAYLDTNGAALIQSMESGFAASSGSSCTASVKAVGGSMVIQVNINELENVDDAVKNTLQETYDAIKGNFVPAFKELKKEIPDLESWVMNICDKNGEFLAAIEVTDDIEAPSVDLSDMTVEEYIDLFGDSILESMEASFATSSGLTCTSSIKGENNNIVIGININELEDVDAATKQTLQETYDSMNSTFAEMVIPMKKTVPDLKAVIINVCDKNGDILAVINAEAQ